jgi:MarR family transcriptional regulator, organic hydroperoxide resistance regulator
VKDYTATQKSPSPASSDGEFEYPLERSIGSQLRKTHRLFERDLAIFLASADVPIGMWYFLRALWEEDGLSQRELSERAGSTAPAAVEQLRNMERRGYIRRERSSTDKRKVNVYLTASGRELKRLLPYAAKVNAIALEGLSEGEIGFLRFVLARMKENFARYWREQQSATSTVHVSGSGRDRT